MATDTIPSTDRSRDGLISVPTGNPCVAGCTVTTLAGTGAAGFADGPGLTAVFDLPAGVAIDDFGTIYVADERNHRVRRATVDSTGRATVGTFAGTGVPDLIDGPAATAAFSSPRDVAIGPGGVVLVADASNHRIRKIENGEVTTLAGTGPSGSLVGSHRDGAAADARFNLTSGVALEPNGRVYVADSGNDVVRVIENGFVSTIGVVGTSGFLDGPANVARFQSPSGVTVAGDGTVYVADTGNHRIRRIPAGGPLRVETIAGSGETGASSSGGLVDGPATSAELAEPSGIVVDDLYRLYVADSRNHRLRVVRNDRGLVVETIAGSGNVGLDGGGFLDGPADHALFQSPRGVAVANDGTIYVGDSENHRLRAIRPDG